MTRITPVDVGSATQRRREAIERPLCHLQQAAREFARVVDDALTLSEQSLGVEVELPDPLFGTLRDVRRLGHRDPNPLLRLALGLRRDRVRCLVRGLENSGDLAADPLEGLTHRRVRRVHDLQLIDPAPQRRYVSVNLGLFVSPPNQRELRVPSGGSGVPAQLQRGWNLIVHALRLACMPQ